MLTARAWLRASGAHAHAFVAPSLAPIVAAPPRIYRSPLPPRSGASGARRCRASAPPPGEGRGGGVANPGAWRCARGVGTAGAAAQMGRGGAGEENASRFSDTRPRARVGGNRSSRCFPDSQVSCFPDEREIIEAFVWDSRLFRLISRL